MRLGSINDLKKTKKYQNILKILGQGPLLRHCGREITNHTNFSREYSCMHALPRIRTRDAIPL